MVPLWAVALIIYALITYTVGISWIGRSFLEANTGAKLWLGLVILFSPILVPVMFLLLLIAG